MIFKGLICIYNDLGQVVDNFREKAKLNLRGKGNCLEGQRVGSWSKWKKERQKKKFKLLYS